MFSKQTRVAVVMAGGSGERFWPLSRRLHPKQLLKLGDPDRSMLRQAVDRIRPMFQPEDIVVITSEHLLAPIREAGLGIPDANILAEPAKRNTAGALVFAAAALTARFGGDPRNITMAVFAADHQIAPDDLFRNDLVKILNTVENRGGLAVIGIPPSRASTGYGYIEIGDKSPGDAEKVRAFKEKPDLATASRYATSGMHYWNSGMFFWRLDEFQRELEAASPRMAAVIPELAALINAGEGTELARKFEQLENISIDYALMEKARTVWMLPARFHWDDLGTWESLRRSAPLDAEGNVTIGDPVIIDTRNSIVVNESGAENIAVAVVGLQNIVVAVTRDGVAVLPADRSEDVSKIVAELKRRGARQV